MITDLENEANLIAGLLRHPHLFPDIPFINENDFSDGDNFHKLIFSVLKKSWEESKSLDVPLIANEISGISIASDFDFLSYLEALKYRTISEKGVLETCGKLKVTTARRDYCEMAMNIIKGMKEANNKKLEEIIALGDKIYGSAAKNYTCINEPIDIYEIMEEIIEANGNIKEGEEPEIPFPYEKFRGLFGDLYPGDLIVIASEMKAGKTTWLQNVNSKIIQNAKDEGRVIRSLTLDTEMETERIVRRVCSQISGVNEALLRGNKWRRNPELVKQIRQVLKDVKKYTGTSEHLYIGNLDTEQMLSQVRRWYWKRIRSQNVGKEGRDIIRGFAILDYFKLTNVDNVTDAFASSMTLGYRVDAFKKLMSELGMGMFSSCQTNAQGDAGLSREIGKFVSALHIYRKLTGEERAKYPGPATHALIPKFTRDQGELAEGNDVYVKIDVGGRIEYKENYINYLVKGFEVIELNTFREQVDSLTHDDGKVKRKTNATDEF